MYDIPENLDLNSLETSAAPAPSEAQTSNLATSSSFDPNQVIRYKASGKDISEPLETVIQRATRGYDYAQLVAQHKQQVAAQQAEFDRRQQELAALEQQWKPYHEYANQNPQWADFVRQQWEQRSSFGQQGTSQFGSIPGQESSFPQNQAQSSVPPEIQRELSEMRQFIQRMEHKEQLAQQAQRDAELANEIDGVRKAYPDIDFSHTDPETGESLEARILRHAQDRRIYDFGAAFKDYYFDKLMERSVMKAKEDVAKSFQNQTKQGFLATSNQPMLVQDQVNQNTIKSMGYHQLMDLAAKEFGL